MEIVMVDNSGDNVIKRPIIFSFKEWGAEKFTVVSFGWKSKMAGTIGPDVM